MCVQLPAFICSLTVSPQFLLRERQGAAFFPVSCLEIFRIKSKNRCVWGVLWDNINSCFHQCDKILEGSKARRSLSRFRCWSSSCQRRHEALRVAGMPWSDLGRWRSRGLELLSDAVRLQGLPPASPSATQDTHPKGSELSCGSATAGTECSNTEVCGKHSRSSHSRIPVTPFQSCT